MYDNEYAKRAKDLFMQGYNCSQAVFCTFAEEMGMDINTALKISSSFGGGMGRLREVCGAVSGMFMAAGLIYGYTDPKDKDAKAEHYKKIQELAKNFKEINGSIVCRELLGDMADRNHIPADRTEKYYKSRPCHELVACAAGILAEYIEAHKEVKSSN